MQNSYQILFLDDNVDLLSTMEIMFSDMEYNEKPLKMHSAIDTQGGYELMLRHPEIALCIVDLNLEKREAGLDFIRQVREDLKNPDVSIFIMTAHQNLLWKYPYNTYDICGILPKGYFQLDVFQKSIYQGLNRYDEKTIAKQVKELYMRLTQMLAMTVGIIQDSGVEGQYELLEDAIKIIVSQLNQTHKNATKSEWTQLYEKLSDFLNFISLETEELPKPHLKLVYSKDPH